MVLYFPHVLYFNRKPSVNDDITQGVIIGQPWAFENEERYFININNAEGAARWIEVPDLYRLKQFFELHADFIADYTFGTYPLKVCFTDISTGPGMVFDGTSALEYLWDFGDGNTSTEKSPCHIYQGPGPYTVTLTITNPILEDTIIKTDYIGDSNNIGDHAYVMGGQTTSATVAVIDKITFPMNGGRSSEIGSLTSPRLRTSACNSTTHGYCIGGYNIPLYNYYSVIDRITFPFNSGTATHINNLSSSRVSEAACNSSQYGYCMGGYKNQSSVSYIGRFSFASDSTPSIQVGQLSISVYGNSSCNSSTHGYSIGGSNIGLQTFSNIQRIEYPFESGTALSSKNISDDRMFSSSCNSSHHGYTFGGYSQNSLIKNQLSTLERFEFSLDLGNSSKMSNLSSSRTYLTSCNSSINGYVIAGSINGQTSTVERFNFPFDTGFVTDAGEISSERHQCSSCDETDFINTFGLIANFNAFPTSVLLGDDVNFVDTSISINSNIDIHSWVFGDGNISDSANPNHTYLIPGNYNVGLTVTDETGYQDTKTKYNWLHVITEEGYVGQHGYSFGGSVYSLDNTTSVIHRITFPFDSGYAELIGSLSNKKCVSSACNSTTHGFALSGLFNSIPISIVDRITFSFNSGTASIINYLNRILDNRSVGNNSSRYGYCSDNSSLSRITFPFESGFAVSNGNLQQSTGSGYDTSFNSSTHGYCTGERHISTKYSTICRFEFPFDSGSGSLIGNLSTTKNYMTACNSSIHGFIMGGKNQVINSDELSNYNISSIDRISFPFNSGTASHNTNLSGTRNASAGVNSSSHGYSMGGLTQPNSLTDGSHCDLVEKFAFPFDAGTGIQAGELLTVQNREMGCDETDFNMLFVFFASFIAEPRSAAIGEEITFTSTSPGNITSYSWDFNGDSTIDSTLPVDTYSYSSAGTYSVTLTVSGPLGTDSITMPNFISVGLAPTADFSVDNDSPSISETINFTDLSTGSITSYLWNFGDGTSSSLQNPSKAYDSSGVYDVSLIVTGPIGSDVETKTSFVSVNIIDAPNANFSWLPSNPDVNISIDFTDSSTGDITSWSWDFGDGDTSSDQNPSHTYTTEGVYDVSLTVTGPGGSDTILASEINISGGGVVIGQLVANFTANNTTIEENDTVNFIDLSTGIITYYVWDFGDGSPVANFEADVTTQTINETISFTDLSTGSPTNWLWNFGDGNTSINQNPTHSYSSIGSYNVYLIATNNSGSTVEIKQSYITISTAINADFSGTPLSGEPNTTVAFTDASTSSGTIDTWLWDFGDSNTSNQQNPSHLYDEEGTFPVSLTVYDEFGNDVETKDNYITIISTLGSVGDYGYIMGGSHNFEVINYYPSIERITFPFDSGTASNVGDLSGSRYAAAGCNSSQYGYCIGGISTAYQSIIDRITFPFNSGTASDVGNLSGSRFELIACNSSQHGYCIGGSTGNISINDRITSIIDRITFPFNSGTASNVGNLSESRFNSTGCNSSQHGYSMGGSNVIINSFSNIDRITFPFNSGTASNVGNLSGSQSAAAGCNSSQHGYSIGGINNYSISIIDRITFPFNSGTASNVGNLSESKYYFSGCNSNQYGYCSGGSSYSKRINRITFPFDSGAASIVGNLSQLASNITSCDETDFNTMFMNISSDFSGTPLSGEPNDNVQFDSTLSSGFIDTYSWNFGDGGSSTSANPSHIYTSEGSYDVSLTVTNTISQDVETKSDYITINPVGGAVGDHGYVMGGNNTDVAVMSTIDRITFPFNSGTASNVGNLSGSQSAAAGCNSSQYGYCIGGYNTSSAIDRITFPFNSGTASHIGDLSESKYRIVGCNSSLHGYCIGGIIITSQFLSTIDRIIFPFDSGTASHIGDLSGSKHSSTGCNSSLHGYCMGGNNPSGLSTIDRIIFPFDSGTASHIGDLSGSKSNCAGCNSSLHGYCMGGNNNASVLSTIDRIVFPFDSGIASHVGNLSETINMSDGCNSIEYGYCMGGRIDPLSTLSTIDRITFPFDSGTASHVGNLSGFNQMHSACDETDFNTMFMDLSAEFSGTPTTGNINTDVAFDSSSSTGFIDTYSWNFGDGYVSSDPDPIHTYESSGQYDVSLTVANTINNGVETKNNYIVISESAVGDYSYIMGTIDNQTTSTVDRITFPFDSGVATSVGNLLWSGITQNAGCNSSQYGYSCGGYSDTTIKPVVMRMQFPFNSGNMINVGALSSVRSNVSACNSSQYGYVFGGIDMGSPPSVSIIDRIAFPFNTGSLATQVGGLDTPRYATASCNSSVHGYIMGGFAYDVPNSKHSVVNRITFPFDTGVSYHIGNLSYSRNYSASCNSSLYGYTMGGTTESTIERITFPFNSGTAVNVGILSIFKSKSQGCNSPQYGYMCGGANSSNIAVSTIDRFAFPFDSGTAIGVGSLTGNRQLNATCDETDFNTLFMDINSDFSASPESGIAGIEVSFSSSLSSGFIDTYSWNFGDGGSSTSANPTHIYESDGNYDVYLFVTNSVNNDVELKSDFINISSNITGNHGYTLGGLFDGTSLSLIERFVFPFNSGTASVAGGLVIERYASAACNSSSHGYIMGGSDDDDITRSSIERMTFPFNSGLTTIVGNLSNSTMYATSCNSSSHGYSIGGYAASDYSHIERIIFPFASGTAISVGDLSMSDLSNASSCNSSLFAYVMGGYNRPYVNYSYIDRFEFPFDSGTTTNVGNLSINHVAGTGCNSTQYGYCLGGSDNNYLSTIDRLLFPFLSGTASNIGNLSASKSHLSSCNSTQYGYSTGGYNVYVNYSAIDRLTFPFNSGTASLVGNLTQTRFANAGCDETDFITQFV